jgi:membrane fusion protein (multidrug efflux system)
MLNTLGLKKRSWTTALRLREDLSADERRLRLRVLSFMGLGAAAALAGFAGVSWWILIGSRVVATDDAYVGAMAAEVAPEIGGAVQAIPVSETQAVKRGDVLVVLDPSDARLALALAQAESGRVLRKVQQYFANADAASARVALQEAELRRAEANYGRRVKLAASGTASREDLTTATAAYESAKAALTVAQSTLAAEQALIQGTDLSSHPEIQAAKTNLEMARLNLERTVIRAPIDGIVAKRQVQLGQHVQVGAPLMSIIPLTEVYVDANFKEGQLEKVRHGQAVTLTSDLYGSDVVFHGRVVGLGGGTGAAFAIIPAQNATGNWIKVVQRLPVRVALQPDELRAHPLRIGLSMSASIDVSR